MFAASHFSLRDVFAPRVEPKRLGTTVGEDTVILGRLSIHDPFYLTKGLTSSTSKYEWPWTRKPPRTGRKILRPVRLAGWALAVGEMVSSYTFQQTCGDEQNQKTGMTIRDSLEALRFHLGESILVHVM
jgi:hypothetical protein